MRTKQKQQSHQSRPSSEWIESVKKYAKYHGIPYKQALQECSKLRGEGLWDKTLNFLFNRKVPKEERLRDGERHAVIMTKDGLRTANYIGPSTQLIDRLKKRIQPATPADKVAMRHDIDYFLSTRPEHVRTADLRMINKLNEIEKNKQDYRWNIQLAKKGIQIKNFAEDKLGVPQSWFAESGDRFKHSPEEVKLVEDAQKQLILEGYGLKKKYILV